MGKADKPNISKHLLDRAAFIFIRHPGIFYSRADIQNILGISKPTACRIMIELSRTMAIEEKMDGRTVYYGLPEEKADRITRSLEFVAAINDRERLALNFLLAAGALPISSDHLSMSSAISLRKQGCCHRIRWLSGRSSVCHRR